MTDNFPCPCCGYRTLHEQPPGTFEICPVCCWEDDNAQFDNPALKGGANEQSLNEARAYFAEHHASSPRFIGAVRAPLPDELSDKCPGSGNADSGRG